jgi:hypothetical protein
MTRHLTYANLVATLALVLALGGTAVAAVDHLDGHSIKPHSIPGNRIKKDGLTGKQVKESKLGTVPSAVNAAHAGVADSLAGGFTPTTFAPARNARFGIGDTAKASQTILELPSLNLRVETDSSTTYSKTATIRNLGSDSVTMIYSSGVGTLAAGATANIAPGMFAGDGTDDATVLFSAHGGLHNAMLHCWFPGGGNTFVYTWCFAAEAD